MPLPPPPSPTLLQQLGIENTAEIKEELDSLSTFSTTSNSSSVLSAGHLSQIEVMVEATIDERSSGYVSTSPLNSCQASSSPSSMCGISADNNATTLIATSSSSPPPSFQHKVRQQNENDMNSHNHFDSGVGADYLGGLRPESSVGQSESDKHSPSGGIYSKFLKEYSNKLLTLSKHKNNNTFPNSNILNDDISSNININSNNTNNLINANDPNKQLAQIPVQTPPHSLQTSDSITFGATKTQPTHSVVAALSSTFANKLKFNPCRQVAKPVATLAPPPPATPDSSSTAQATTTISSSNAISTFLNTINNNSTNNYNESGQFVGATQSIHREGTDFTSAMLGYTSPALDTAPNNQPFGEYVTLTGSVIRSVVPPGKGVNINYKVSILVHHVLELVSFLLFNHLIICEYEPILAQILNQIFKLGLFFILFYLLVNFTPEYLKTLIFID